MTTGLGRPASRVRILLAKPGLDGHDRGVHVVARTLRDAGFEVIYTGLRATPEQIVRSAVQEDVDVIGLSILSGVHLPLTAEVLEALRHEEVSIPVVVGGTIGPRDAPVLEEMGVADVFPIGSRRGEIVDRLRRLVDGRPDPSAAGGAGAETA
ncbi:MAG TPA: cobalamin B12-binding domain-containing protein [Actinomycetes bacterium]|jgi:methylmalonyl-CoA mutase C-terminal domain/subunit|nr:cobalamin B12-binding domain-containing protein [Actinomycetes bacterium]